MKKEIVASIIAKTQKELDSRIKKVKNHVSVIQLDIMDRTFLKNHSLDFEFLLKDTKCRTEAHLMIKDPEDWIEINAKNVNTVIFHIETTKNPKKAIKLIKKKRKRAGIAINPRTKVSSIKKYLKDIDQVLVMTVNPGRYGAKFLPGTLKKVKELRKIDKKLDIEVDGGITPKTINKAALAGANRFVSGSYLQKSKDIRKAIIRLKEV